MSSREKFVQKTKWNEISK